MTDDTNNTIYDVRMVARARRLQAMTQKLLKNAKQALAATPQAQQVKQYEDTLKRCKHDTTTAEVGYKVRAQTISNKTGQVDFEGGKIKMITRQDYDEMDALGKVLEMCNNPDENVARTARNCLKLDKRAFGTLIKTGLVDDIVTTQQNATLYLDSDLSDWLEGEEVGNE